MFMNARVPWAGPFGKGAQPIFFFYEFKFELVSGKFQGFCLVEPFHGQLVNILILFSFYDHK